MDAKVIFSNSDLKVMLKFIPTVDEWKNNPEIQPKIS
jgi:hypothetical protein